LNFNDFKNKTKNKSGVFVTVLSLKGKNNKKGKYKKKYPVKKRIYDFF
jgi:hypothetical protein